MAAGCSLRLLYLGYYKKTNFTVAKIEIFGCNFRTLTTVIFCRSYLNIVKESGRLPVIHVVGEREFLLVGDQAAHTNLVLYDVIIIVVKRFRHLTKPTLPIYRQLILSCQKAVVNLIADINI